MFEALFVKCSEQGIVKAIIDDFRNFHKISGYLQGHNSIGLVLTLQKRIIFQYCIYLFSIAINKIECSYERYLQRSTLFKVHVNAAVTQGCVAILCI